VLLKEPSVWIYFYGVSTTRRALISFSSIVISACFFLLN